MFLTASELRDLTGRSQAKRQAEWLRANDLLYGLAPSGRPLVLRAPFESPARPPEPTAAEISYQMSCEPWLVSGNTQHEWLCANRACFEISFERIKASTELYTRNAGTEREGVYFLFFGQTLLYVGLSVCIAARLTAHRRDWHIPFDSFAYVEVPTLWLSCVEGRYITKLRPPFNVRGIQ